MIHCPICGGEARLSYSATDENHRCTPVEFHYATCGMCGTVFLTNPPPDLGRYYEADYYAIPTLERLDAIARKDCNKIEIINRFASGKQLARYCGLTPCNASIGERQADAGLVKGCNGVLRGRWCSWPTG